MNFRSHMVFFVVWTSGFTLSTTKCFLSLSNLAFRKRSCLEQSTAPYRHSPLLVSSGFIFEDGEQVLASLQKPLGLILEEEDDTAGLASVFVAEVLPGSSGASAGLEVGDVVIAVQNADMKGQNLEYVMSAIQRAPKVLNMRLQRKNK